MKEKLLTEAIRREQQILELRCRIWYLDTKVSAANPAGKELYDAGDELDKLLRNYRSWLRRHDADLALAGLYIRPLH